MLENEREPAAGEDETSWLKRIAEINVKQERLLDLRLDGDITAKQFRRSTKLTPSSYKPYPLRSQSSGTISATSSPSSNILTVELSETATATASVRLDTEAAATWRLPSPRGSSRWLETAST